MPTQWLRRYSRAHTTYRYYEDAQQARRETIEARIRAEVRALQLAVAADKARAQAKRDKRLRGVLDSERRTKEKLDKVACIPLLDVRPQHTPAPSFSCLFSLMCV